MLAIEVLSIVFLKVSVSGLPETGSLSLFTWLKKSIKKSMINHTRRGTQHDI